MSSTNKISRRSCCIGRLHWEKKSPASKKRWVFVTRLSILSILKIFFLQNWQFFAKIFFIPFKNVFNSFCLTNDQFKKMICFFFYICFTKRKKEEMFWKILVVSEKRFLGMQKVFLSLETLLQAAQDKSFELSSKFVFLTALQTKLIVIFWKTSHSSKILFFPSSSSERLLFVIF